MARIVMAKQVRVGAKVTIVDGQVINSGGHILKEVPTLYDANGNYVTPVNIHFLNLAVDHKDLSSDRRALCRYWTFLEREQLAWDDFSMPKNLKPTYRWRNELKRAADAGEIAYSTASSYICRMVVFYKFVMSNGMLRISDEKDAPFKFEWIDIVR